MKYLSVCSGVEAATVAWHPLGWEPVAFSEIEKFPSQVLAHHYPSVPNLGDMTKYKEWELNDTIGLLVGGTPCQSFSVAGLRKGLEDPRGNLALTYVGILDKFRPKWFVWENVPGVLSSGGGRDFGSFLGAVAELGYGFSYRVLDAQFFGVPQRRRRVFVVGYLGDWEPTAKVLFESEGLRRDTKTSREKRKEVASSVVPSVANCLQTTCNDYSRADGFNMICTDIVGPLTARDHKGIGSDDCNPTMAKMVAYENHPNDSRIKEMGNTCTTVTSRWGTGGGNVPLVQPVAHIGTAAVGVDIYNASESGNIAVTLTASGNSSTNSGPKVMQEMAVRRLTPVECERLQGFPDDYTNIRENCPDGPRYKAMGNSMAVPVMSWIGKRIQMVENEKRTVSESN